jgi:hypothetical protein
MSGASLWKNRCRLFIAYVLIHSDSGVYCFPEAVFHIVLKRDILLQERLVANFREILGRSGDTGQHGEIHFLSTWYFYFFCCSLHRCRDSAMVVPAHGEDIRELHLRETEVYLIHNSDVLTENCNSVLPTLHSSLSLWSYRLLYAVALPSRTRL